ncbi:putative DNA-binding domain-containing protein [Erythrobacter sp. SCSIO 43205]|uniref:HvfC/BufC N-terminal domain-containing protein n=1 Tax=Erythrobacter sp. SCSIO 43205 TaxID=2779361 RepID=UPI001CA8BFA0|nr:DNA-binding domain-containing protein [Erythrobacter sp. SCSIO 43205]UAB78137.1 putative DNA-binding domain-containing protein [Erythrobacter sp. SCSIO 43205]
MSTLAERQEAFLEHVLDENAPAPTGWGNRHAEGMAVYRGNYRSALMGALSETYERTALYLGGQTFARAAINHAIAHPPRGWTIDAAGAGFDQTCAEMFNDNPEVAELAWLEWAMLELATAPDCAPLSTQDFARISADFGEDDWANLRFGFQPRLAVRLVSHNLEAIWRALPEKAEAITLDTPQACIASREGEKPTFVLVEADHAPAIAAMHQGASYGELIAVLLGEEDNPTPEAIHTAAMRAGSMLGEWLTHGLITAINPS